MKLSGRKAIVTGAARGLGRAYARRLAKLGADVVALDIDPDGAAAFGEVSSDPAEQMLDSRITNHQADLTHRDQAEAAIDRAIRTLGGIDILVNNAGGAIAPADRSLPSIMGDDDIETIFKANLMSTIYCCQAVLPHMKAKGGAIVNTSSMAARAVAAGGAMAHYSAAKAAVTSFTRHLAAEAGPSAIRVNCIAPGIILTGRIKALAQERGIGTAADAQEIPLRRLGTPEDCAAVIEFLVSDDSAYVTGQCISVCGGKALSPA